MLCIELKYDEKICLTENGREIGSIKIAEKSNNKFVRLSFDFPKSVTINRELIGNRQ